MKASCTAALLVIFTVFEASAQKAPETVPAPPMDEWGIPTNPAGVKCSWSNDPTPKVRKEDLLRPPTSLRGFKQAKLDDSPKVIADSGQLRTYRACNYDQSLEVEVSTGSDQGNLHRLLVVAPGNCADFDTEFASVRYVCEYFPGGQCANRKPLYFECKKNGVVIERHAYLTQGWAVSHSDFKDRLPPGGRRYGPRSGFKFSQPSDRNAFDSITLAKFSSSRLYAVCRSGPGFQLLVDGATKLFPTSGCTEAFGKEFVVKLDDPTKRTATGSFYAFLPDDK